MKLDSELALKMPSKELPSRQLENIVEQREE